MIEAGVAAGYVIAWVVRKARQTVGRLDAEASAVIDAGLDRLYEVVMAKLARHPVLEELEEEAATGTGQISELTRQQVELALTAAARKDEAFGQAIAELVAQVREAEQAGGRHQLAGGGSAVFGGDAYVRSDGGGIAFGQVAGGVHLDRGPMGPSQPGRSDR